MTNGLVKRLVAASAALGMTAAAEAAFIDHDYYTTDTVSGLDWLDVTESVNMSYFDVAAALSVGGDFEGWRYATSDEFLALVSNYTGRTVSTIEKVNQEPDRIDGLVDLLGSTLDSYYIETYGITYDQYNGFPEGSGRDYTLGRIADRPNTSAHRAAMLDDSDASPSDIDLSAAYWASYFDTTVGGALGSYLVRNTIAESNTVAEPSAFALVSLGLFFLSVFGALRRPRFVAGKGHWYYA